MELSTRAMTVSFSTMDGREGECRGGKDDPVYSCRRKLRIRVRRMTHEDVPDVVRIERESFEFPWLEDAFMRCMRPGNATPMVAVYEGHVVGSMVYEINRARLYVPNFAVAVDFRRCGVGSQMLAMLIQQQQAIRSARIIAEVRELSVDGNLFFLARNFQEIHVLWGAHDAHYMHYLSPHAHRITRLVG